MCVQQAPAQLVEQGKAVNFQKNFVKSILSTEEIAPTFGVDASDGTLSHTHLNVTLRNVRAGAVGCACPKPVVTDAEGYCECGNNVICDETGKYCMKKIGARDKDWETAVYKGLKWQRLSYKMDIEQPQAARVISIALNEKNSFAMETGHTEIMAFIFRNVNPQPQATLFEPIKMELIALHGLAVDDQNLRSLFIYAMEAGGNGSDHLIDLSNFCAAAVDPKIRKFKMESYKIVREGIPKTMQRIRLAATCWAYKQDKNKDNWCALPPDFSNRTNSDCSYNWCDFLQNLDNVLLHVRKICSADSEVTFVKDLKERTLWMADVHNQVIRLLKVDKHKCKEKHEKQLNQAIEKVGKLLASKIRTLLLDQTPMGLPIESSKVPHFGYKLIVD